MDPPKDLKDILANTKASQQNPKSFDDTNLQLWQTNSSNQSHLTTMKLKTGTTNHISRGSQAIKSRGTSTCRNLRRKQLRLAERQRKSEFIQSQIQLFPFERQKKPMTLKKKSKKTSIALLARDKATNVKAKSHHRHHYNSNLHSLWNLCMAHPHMMDMLLQVYPALWNVKAASLESSRPNQNVDPQEDEVFQEPSKKQRNVSQSMTFIEACTTTHTGMIHNTAHLDFFQKPCTAAAGRTYILNEDIIERSPTPAIVTPMFNNDDDLIMKPFVSIVSDSMSGRKLLDDLTLESRQNLSPDHRPHFYEKDNDDDDDNISIYSSDFLMALEGIHVDHSEDSIGSSSSKVGTVTVEMMKCQW